MELTLKLKDWTLIALVVGIIIVALSFIGYNTYITYSDENKKIEVRAMNSNSLE